MSTNNGDRQDNDPTMYAAAEPPTSGDGVNNDYVMVPRGDLLQVRLFASILLQNSEGCVRQHHKQDEIPGWLADCARGVALVDKALSAAPPSPRSDDGSGLTPSKHGFSAALRAQVSPDAESCYCPNCNIPPPERERFRAQVIEECAKVAEQAERDYLSPEYATGQPMSSLAERIACRSVAASIRSLSSVSAIAQERDVGEWEPIDTAPEDRVIELGRFPNVTDGNRINFFIGNARVSHPEMTHWREHPTTSPSAIGEAPTSAEAVKTSPEVGEMVERLNDIGLHCTLDLRRQAASLLIALDAERGRLRTATSEVEGYLREQAQGEQCGMLLDWANKLRAAL